MIMHRVDLSSDQKIHLAPVRQSPTKQYDETLDWTSEGTSTTHRAILAWASDVYLGG